MGQFDFLSSLLRLKPARRAASIQEFKIRIDINLNGNLGGIPTVFSLTWVSVEFNAVTCGIDMEPPKINARTIGGITLVKSSAHRNEWKCDFCSHVELLSQLFFPHVDVFEINTGSDF